MKNTYLFLFIALFLTSFVAKAQTKTDVWDFGAAQFDALLYNNNLTEDVINAWYPGVTPGTTGKNVPATFTAGVLTWTSNSSTSDRLRTSNTNLTRYDSNGVPVTVSSTSESLTGYIYVNASGAVGRYFSLDLNEDDEITIYAKSQNGTGKMTFEYIVDATQKDVSSLTTSPVIYKYQAKKGGIYKIYDTVDKPFYYRILRKPATYVTVSGTVDLTNASDIPAGYSLNFTNEAGKVWNVSPDASNNYTLQLPAGYNYTPSLVNANGFIISNADKLTITSNTTYNPSILKVTLFTQSGNITGLSSTELSKLKLFYNPSESRIYVPKPVVNVSAATYSVQIEGGVSYTISATDVNDYYIADNTINIVTDETKNIAFAAKPTYKVTLNTADLDNTQLSKLNVTFTNLNETAGYAYTFTDLNDIYLRDGTYTISCNGLDEYPLQLGATSNLVVAGTPTTKNLSFDPVTVWSFNDATITSGVTTAYKGMLFTGAAYNEKAKGHLVMSGTSTAKVPVSPGQKMIVYYYYSASYNVDGGTTVSTTSGSTSLIESKEFVYGGSVNGYMTINNVSGTTYLTEVKVVNAVPYTSVITVGTDKNYQTINDALAAVRCMTRTSTDTVKVMIDPGNYEEMLMIDVPNVTLANASSAPSIRLLNNGVDIDPNSVRITSYYGHGYNYFSMNSNQKWSAETLKVNKENGYISYTNAGSGTTNGSYWNATVVVTASGFRADNIVFENSFNQYISKKESEDVVQEWATGGKGTRPTTLGSTAVQQKTYVERAAAIALTAGGDRTILNKCRIIGRQDSFYGAEGARVVTYKGAIMGATDFIFGGMTLVSYQTDLTMNTSETNTDVAYITAAQQTSSRGYLMYECKVTSAEPSIETASMYRSKPGYFGRPWQPTTSEVVFYNTTIETTDNPSYAGQSLILPEGWNNSLGGTSNKVYEYQSTELSGVNNSASRASWSNVLTTPVLNDNTEITTFNFTKGTDNWDPFTSLKEKDIETSIKNKNDISVQIIGRGESVRVANVNLPSKIYIYSTDGSLKITENISQDTSILLENGVWIVRAVNSEGSKTVKIVIK
ncbi:MAG: pectinesterase family protein [Paludibacteraceae bacterium]